MSRWKSKRRNPSRRSSLRPPIIGEVLELPEDSPIRATISPIYAEDFNALQDYFAAHALLPPMWIYDPEDPRQWELIERAIRTLKRSTGPDEATRAAVVLLGHTPEPRAIAALQRLARALHPCAGLARMALDECLTIVAEEMAGTGAVPLARAN